MLNAKKQQRARILYVTQAGLIASLYTVLTLFVGAFGLANGAIQLRISEALCVLPFFTPAAIPGLAIGCLISNLITGCLWQDVLFGTLATLLGAVGASLLRRTPYLVPLPTVRQVKPAFARRSFAAAALCPTTLGTAASILAISSAV